MKCDFCDKEATGGFVLSTLDELNFCDEHNNQEACDIVAARLHSDKVVEVSTMDDGPYRRFLRKS
jgi:hypothetical protein